MSVLLNTSRQFIARGRIVATRNLATISCENFGAPSAVLGVSSTSPAVGAPVAGELKISVKASAVTTEDVRAVHGLSLTNSCVGVCGTSASGVVTAVPSGESGFAVNDKVFVVGSGLWTDEVVVSQSGVSTVGSALSAGEIAMLPGFASAWGILHNYTTLSAGDVVVQSTGACAVGAAITQLGQALGLKVISLADADLADPAALKTKLKQTGEIKLTVSGQSGKHLSTMQNATAANGALVTYNGVFETLHSSAAVQSPVSSMIFNNVKVCGFDLHAWTKHDPAHYKQSVASLLSLIESKKVSLKPAKEFPQADVKKVIDGVAATGATAVLKH